MERTFDQFARVLVNMDVTQEPRYKVLVESKGYVFFVDLDYENIPEFCDYCKKIGHNVSVCNNLHETEVNHYSSAQKLANKLASKKYVQVKDGRKK